MTTLNQGRNEIRFNNSNGKCLLENWVEERAVTDIDPQDLNGDMSSSAQLFKDGHKGLLTTDDGQSVQNRTTFRDSYTPPKGPNVRLRGAKAEALEKMLYDKVSKEVHDEFNKPPEVAEYKSITHKDYNIEDFESKKPAPTATHDVFYEQPVTFWTEHRDKIHGTTQVKTHDTPFRKNTSFSKPIEEYWEQPKPYEDEMVPKM